MRKKYLAMLAAGMTACLLGFNPVFAADDDAMPQALEQTEMVFGEILSVSGSVLEVRHYEEDKGLVFQEKYQVTPQTRLENFKSPGDLAPQDNVAIDFLDRDGVRLARYIYVEKSPYKFRTETAARIRAGKWEPKKPGSRPMPAASASPADGLLR